MQVSHAMWQTSARVDSQVWLVWVLTRSDAIDHNDDIDILVHALYLANNKTIWRHLALLVVRNCVILARFLAIMRRLASRWSAATTLEQEGSVQVRGSFRRGSSSTYTYVIAGPSIGQDDNKDMH